MTIKGYCIKLESAFRLNSNEHINYQIVQVGENMVWTWQSKYVHFRQKSEFYDYFRFLVSPAPAIGRSCFLSVLQDFHAISRYM